MMQSDRERLAMSTAIAVGIHLLLLGSLYVFGWSIDKLPDYEPPIYVSLEEFELEKVEVPLREHEPVPEELSQAEPEPDPAPAPEPDPAPAPEPDPAPAPEPDPAPAPDPAPEPPSASVAEPEAPPPETRREPLPPPDDVDLLGGERTAERTRPDRPRYELDEFAPETEDPELPDWVTADQRDSDPAARMDEREAGQLARRLDRDPEFERQLREVLRSVGEARRAEPRTPGDADGPADTRRDAPAEATAPANGNGMIRGISGRGQPNIGLSFTAADFDDNVPPTTTIVVVFDVDPRGFVIPGSLILQQQSRYTRVNEKVREEVRGWRFEPLPSGQTRTQTGIFTLVINRGDVI